MEVKPWPQQSKQGWKGSQDFTSQLKGLLLGEAFSDTHTLGYPMVDFIGILHFIVHTLVAQMKFNAHLSYYLLTVDFWGEMGEKTHKKHVNETWRKWLG